MSRAPVVVGVAQRNAREGDTEPIQLMTDVAEAAIADAGSPRLRSKIDWVRVVRGIWPYRDPGRMIARELGLDGVATAITQIGGNEVYDLITKTAAAIQAGELDAALICSAETMRTRRGDRKAGRKTSYREESEGAEPDLTVSAPRELVSELETEAGPADPVVFYAMAESVVSHRRDVPVAEHLRHIAGLWSRASEVASHNPHAWLGAHKSPEELLEVAPSNRMVAEPYPKLLTSNVDVDQGAAVIICAEEVAREAGVPADRWIFPWVGTGAVDSWSMSRRWSLAESPALAEAGRRALHHAGIGLDDTDLIDLYSCFPSAIQVAQAELGLAPDRPFTITGGLTFAGGPYNSYCLHAFARGVELLRERGEERAFAFLTGNGGYFTKHAAVVLGTRPRTGGYVAEWVAGGDELSKLRPVAAGQPASGEVEAHTVTYGREGPERAVVAVLDEHGARWWANNRDEATIDQVSGRDLIGEAVDLHFEGNGSGIPQITFR